MDCFKQEKNIAYKIEKYNGLNNTWEDKTYNYENYEKALEFYNNNNALNNSLFTDEHKKNNNFSVFRIVEVKTIIKPILTNTELLKVEKDNVKMLRKKRLI
jgi:hypothetical protein